MTIVSLTIQQLSDDCGQRAGGHDEEFACNDSCNDGVNAGRLLGAAGSGSAAARSSDDRHRHHPAQSGQPARISPLRHHWRTAADRKTMLERLPEIQKVAPLTRETDEVLPFDQPQELKELSLRMGARLAEPGIAGVVFTHGTNTMEETAYFMNLTIRNDKPVVIVGAQRAFSTLSSDGPLNLLNAIRVAADPVSRGK